MTDPTLDICRCGHKRDLHGHLCCLYRIEFREECDCEGFYLKYFYRVSLSIVNGEAIFIYWRHEIFRFREASVALDFFCLTGG